MGQYFAMGKRHQEKPIPVLVQTLRIKKRKVFFPELLNKFLKKLQKDLKMYNPT